MEFTPNELLDGVPFDVYLADPADEPSLTNSEGRAILAKSPREVWQNSRRLNPNWAPKPSKDTFEIGSVFHEHVLLTGDPYVVVKADSWRTNAAKAARAGAVGRGKVPILEKHYKTVIAMDREFRDQCRDISVGGGLTLAQLVEESAKEQTILWHEAGVWNRCRPDMYHVASNTMIHLKSSGVDVTQFSADKYAANQEWQFMLAHYEAGGQAAFGSAPRQLVVICKTDAPHLVLPLEFGGATMALGRKERALALMKWRKCVTTNTWPGFPSKVVKVDVPEWKERQILDREVAEDDAKVAGKDLLEQAIMWQAPTGWNPPARQGERNSDDVIEEGEA